jgi:hypothetical protein
MGPDFIQPVKSAGVREMGNSVMTIRVKFTAKPGAHFLIHRESYTLQILPPGRRAEAVRCIRSFVASKGALLVIARGREPSDPKGEMPWPLTKEDLSLFEAHGLKEVSLEDFMDNEEPPVRRFRATYCRKS